MNEMVRLRSLVTTDALPPETPWEDAYGVPPPIEYERDGGLSVDLEWYAEDDASADVLVDQLAAVPFLAPLSRETITSDDWQSYWKEHFHIKRVGEHIMLVPEWEVESFTPDADDLVLIVRPGLGFGTGEHFTTSFCLSAMERHGGGLDSFADAGTGCGVLAVAAVKLGFTHVFAFDNDPMACESARDNFELNDVTGKIQLACCDLEGLAPFTAQFVCANLYDTVLIKYADFLSKSAQSILVCTGIRAEKADDVEAVYVQNGLRLIEKSASEEWCGLVFAVST